MRVVIQGKELEFRVQERRITTCSVFHQGKEIAADLTIYAPQDVYDQREGEKIAVTRAVQILFERQQQERVEAIQKVDKVFTEVGAASGSVEFPLLEAPAGIVNRIMDKLDARRAAKAKVAAENTLQAARNAVKLFRDKFPPLRPPVPAGLGSILGGIPWFSSPFLGRQGVILHGPGFDLGAELAKRPGLKKI